MWNKRGWKRKNDGDDKYDSSSGSRSATNDSNDNDSSFVCELPNNRKVSVREFGGKILVDIREYYFKDGKTLPGKKGISLSLDQWNILREHIDEIDNGVDENA